ncbi:MAG TPA: hypothetical protein VHQ65_09575 [Thermoanaerobaculia bacterium]|nr:hypothetical protein [Thermoanaerobaculia bacterium]
MRSLAEHLHQHLIAQCPECRAAWEALGEGRQEILAMLGRQVTEGEPMAAAAGELADGSDGLPFLDDAPSATPELRGRVAQGTSQRRPRPPAAMAIDLRGGSPYSSAFDRVTRQLEEEAARLRTRRRRAERELRHLLKFPAAERRQRVLAARTRYRSRAFAERLLEESRRRVRTDAREAAGLAELVPLVVLWTPGALPSAWGDELVIRARAWQANALRVAGDLHRADHELSTLRRELTGRPLNDEIAGELDSLEASLRLDQGRFPEAGTCLDRAVECLAESGQPEAWARAMVQRAELYRLLGQSSEALETAREALSRLDPEKHTVPYLCAIGTQVLALCDLDRPREARHLLTENASRWRRSPEDWWLLRLAIFEGRIYFGLGEMTAAEGSFRLVLQRCRDLGLDYESAMATIDLSMALLAQGRTAEVRRLTSEAAPVFISRDLHRESLAALALFQRAAQAESLTLASARRIREYLDRSRMRSHPAADS